MHSFYNFFIRDFRGDERENKKRTTKMGMAGRCKGMLKRKAQERDAWKIIVKRALDTNG